MNRYSKKGYTLWEIVLSLAIIGILMGFTLMIYRTMLFRYTVINEAVLLKRNLEYARDWANTHTQDVLWSLQENTYTLKSGSQLIRTHHIPQRVKINGKTFAFNPNLTPSRGQTIIISLDKYNSRVVIDPATGRIRIAQ